MYYLGLVLRKLDGEEIEVDWSSYNLSDLSDRHWYISKGDRKLFQESPEILAQLNQVKIDEKIYDKHGQEKYRVIIVKHYSNCS